MSEKTNEGETTSKGGSEKIAWWHGTLKKAVAVWQGTKQFKTCCYGKISNICYMPGIITTQHDIIIHGPVDNGEIRTPASKCVSCWTSLFLSFSSTSNLFFLPFMLFSSNSTEAEHCYWMCCHIFILNSSGLSVHLCQSLHFLSFPVYSDKIHSSYWLA